MTGFSRLLPLVGAAALLLAACGDGDGDGQASERRVEHVHGLGINPANGALYIATHSGVFRSPEGSQKAEPVGEGLQDTMGFTIVGADHFLASGHPGPGEDGPPNLGLISSTDGGESWKEVSLGGEADFHALRSAHDRVYGYDATGDRLMVSGDDGESWAERTRPAAILDLAIDPTDAKRIVASTERGLSLSDDDGRSWGSIGPRDAIGFLAWPVEERLYLVDAQGDVRMSANGGRRWKRVGEIGGQPAALVAESESELYAALPDGTVVGSTDSGSSWKVRSTP